MSSRYLIAVIVGLAVGAAIGWVSGRESQPSQQVAAGHHRSHHARTHPAAPAPKPDDAGQPRVLTFRQVQQRVARCMYGSATVTQQVTCLRKLLRSQLGTGLQGLPTDLSPFMFPGDQSGYG